MPQPLPAGVTPVQAGRFGLWLLGKRNQAKAARRRGIVTRAYTRSRLDALSGLTVPWTVNEYPGAYRFFSEILGVSRQSVKRWLASDHGLPRKQALRLSSLCRDRAAAFAALADEFAAIAAEERPSRKRLKRESRGG
jgi:hypothetical protein